VRSAINRWDVDYEKVACAKFIELCWSLVGEENRQGIGGSIRSRCSGSRHLINHHYEYLGGEEDHWCQSREYKHYLWQLTA
jgi:hypothetical protein